MPNPYVKNTQRSVPIINDISARTSNPALPVATATDIVITDADSLIELFNNSTELVLVRIKTAAQTSAAAVAVGGFDFVLPGGAFRHIGLTTNDATAISLISASGGAAPIVYALK